MYGRGVLSAIVSALAPKSSSFSLPLTMQMPALVEGIAALKCHLHALSGWLLALKRANLAVYPIGGTSHLCDPFGIPSPSHWTGAAIIVQFSRRDCMARRVENLESGRCLLFGR